MAEQVIWNIKTPIKEKYTNIKCSTEMHSKLRHANSEEATIGPLLNLLQTVMLNYWII